MGFSWVLGIINRIPYKATLPDSSESTIILTTLLSPPPPPSQETLADQLEEAYRKCAARDQPVWDGSAWVSAVRRREEPLQVTLNTRVESGLYVQLFSSREMYLCRSGTLAWLSKKLGSEGRLRLRRGYLPPRAKPLLDKEADARQEAADMVASTTPVRDLVLCVHGIGQTLSTSSIATVRSSGGMNEEWRG